MLFEIHSAFLEPPSYPASSFSLTSVKPAFAVRDEDSRYEIALELSRMALLGYRLAACSLAIGKRGGGGGGLQNYADIDWYYLAPPPSKGKLAVTPSWLLKNTDQPLPSSTYIYRFSPYQGPRCKFSSGGAKEEWVKENWGGGVCLRISIKFL